VTGPDARDGRVVEMGPLLLVKIPFAPIVEAVDTVRGQAVIVSADVAMSKPTVYGPLRQAF